MSLLAFGPRGYPAPGGGGGTLAVLNTSATFATSSTTTKSGIPCGTATATRRVTLYVLTNGATPTFTLNGVAATVSRTKAMVGGFAGYYRHWVDAVLTSGTTVTIICTAGATEMYGCMCFTVDGAASTFDAGADGTGDAGSVGVTAGGVVLAERQRLFSANPSDCTWTGGLTKVNGLWDGGATDNYSLAIGAFASTQTVNYGCTFVGGTPTGLEQNNFAISYKP